MTLDGPNRESLETETDASPRSFVSEARADSSESARVLPRSAYHTRAAQAKEDAAIWTRNWVCLGFAADVPNPGDVLPFTVGNHGIHVERLADGSLVGRFNKAQHGGCRVVPLQCQTGSKTKCSFTACGYSRDRRPIAASDSDRLKHLDQYVGLRPERLLPVTVRMWGPLVLANLDPLHLPAMHLPAITWSSALAAAGSAIGGQTVWLEYDANWKHLAISLAAGRADGVETHLFFPNVIVMTLYHALCMVVLQPTALAKTMCRIRLFEREETTSAPASAEEEALAMVASRARRAEAWQSEDGLSMDAVDASAIGQATHRFESDVQSAFDLLDRGMPDTVLFQTNHKGGW